MKIKLFQVDAFAERPFEGNPAAVCPLDQWLDDALLQAIAEENNLSETAYLVSAGDSYELRWFTPAQEVDLCGHATLASAHVLYTHLGYDRPQVEFMTRSGTLTVSPCDQGYSMNFPAAVLETIEAPAALISALGKVPLAAFSASDYVVVYASEEDVRAITPDFAKLKSLELRGVVVTAPGKEVDFVSRCFFPKLGVNEDPVTGSAHCELAPYWSDRLGRNKLLARQLSRRGGQLVCEIHQDRVLLVGSVVDYLVAEIRLDA
jgi:PhzF family phenazine biosynthesis protein